jgi:hypothetical protein
MDHETMNFTQTAQPPETLALVLARYPEKAGLKRRIAHLWGNCFRVNYYSPELQNCVVESHFVQVQAQQVVEKN